MSLLHSPRRPSSDDLEPDLHVGFDRELDLSAERPHVPPAERGRGPGLLVAGIVASSLVLAGVIMLARGDANEAAASEPAPSAAVPEVVAAPSEPAELEAVPSEPTPTTPPTPGRVAAHQPVAPAPAPAPSADPEPADVPSSPAAVSPAAIAPAAAAPAASTPAHPTARPPAPPNDPAPSPAEAGGGRLELPPPVFDEPTPAPDPAPVDDSADPLPGVEEPSIFAPEDEYEEDDADADEPSMPSSATTPDRQEATPDDDRALSDAPAA